MYSNILVPVLFDDDARIARALDLARTLAGPDGRITVMHVMEDVPSYAMRYLSEDFMKTAAQAIQAQLSDLASSIANAKGVLVHGHSSRSILDYASEHENDLIIIGSHRPGMQDLILGSTATQLTRHATASVLVLR